MNCNKLNVIASEHSTNWLRTHGLYCNWHSCLFYTVENFWFRGHGKDGAPLFPCFLLKTATMYWLCTLFLMQLFAVFFGPCAIFLVITKFLCGQMLVSNWTRQHQVWYAALVIAPCHFSALPSLNTHLSNVCAGRHSGPYSFIFLEWTWYNPQFGNTVRPAVVFLWFGTSL